MPAISMTVRGGDELRRNLARLQGNERRRAQAAALDAGASVVETWAKYYAPVDLGYLQGSINVDRPVTALEATVSVGAEYAIHQEFGTYKMAAHPFMRPAMDQHEREIIGAVETIIASFVEGIHE